jgi:hypothetical protein
VLTGLYVFNDAFTLSFEQLKINTMTKETIKKGIPERMLIFFMERNFKYAKGN